MRKVELGRIQATKAALQVFEMTGENIWDFVDRHQAALRRKLSEIDEHSLEPGCQLLSTYKLRNGLPLGILTEPDDSKTVVFLIES